MGLKTKPDGKVNFIFDEHEKEMRITGHFLLLLLLAAPSFKVCLKNEYGGCPGALKWGPGPSPNFRSSSVRPALAKEGKKVSE